MKRRLARSFVVTLAMVPACSRDGTTVSNPPPPPTIASATASVTTTPPQETKKRRRSATTPTPFVAANNVPFGELVSQQPTDAKGRTIFVGYDDRCYVEEPMKQPHPPMPTGARPVTSAFVDCPASVDDPAWDTCGSSQLMLAPSKTHCFCVPVGGNPPPPPTSNACPAGVKGSAK